MISTFLKYFSERQFICFSKLTWKKHITSKTVSYTHLDVYKRQVVEDSRPIDFGEDRLRGKGSLPATFYVLTRVK